MASQSYPLDLVREDPCLTSYLSSLKILALSEREHYAELADLFEADYMKATESFPEDMHRIHALEDHYNDLVQSEGGVPDTEGVYTNRKESRNPDEVADRFLLKQAYRVAASVAHPDKQGGSAEEFALLNAAYKAGDLDTIMSYYLGRCGNLHQRLHFWYTETQKPRVRWLEFCNTVQYRVVVLRMNGDYHRARLLVKQALNQVAASLAAKIVETLKRKSNGKSRNESQEENQARSESEGSGQEGLPAQEGWRRESKVQEEAPPNVQGPC